MLKRILARLGQRLRHPKSSDQPLAPNPCSSESGQPRHFFQLTPDEQAQRDREFLMMLHAPGGINVVPSRQTPEDFARFVSTLTPEDLRRCGVGQPDIVTGTIGSEPEFWGPVRRTHRS